jgi:hypothetical protein
MNSSVSSIEILTASCNNHSFSLFENNLKVLGTPKLFPQVSPAVLFPHRLFSPLPAKTTIAKIATTNPPDITSRVLLKSVVMISPSVPSTSKIPRRHTASLSLTSSITASCTSSSVAFLPCGSSPNIRSKYTGNSSIHTTAEKNHTDQPSACGATSEHAKHGHRRTLSKLPLPRLTTANIADNCAEPRSSTVSTDCISRGDAHAITKIFQIDMYNIVASSNSQQTSAQVVSQARHMVLGNHQEADGARADTQLNLSEGPHLDVTSRGVFTRDTTEPKTEESQIADHTITTSNFQLRPLHLCQHTVITSRDNNVDYMRLRPRLIRPKTFAIVKHTGALASADLVDDDDARIRRCQPEYKER